MRQLIRWRRRDQLRAQREKISDLPAPRVGRDAISLARDKVRNAPVRIDQLHLCATLELLAFRLQLAPREPRILRADQAVTVRHQRPHSEHPALHPRLYDPDDTRALDVDRLEHRGKIRDWRCG